MLWCATCTSLPPNQPCFLLDICCFQLFASLRVVPPQYALHDAQPWRNTSFAYGELRPIKRFQVPRMSQGKYTGWSAHQVFQHVQRWFFEWCECKSRTITFLVKTYPAIVQWSPWWILVDSRRPRARKCVKFARNLSDKSILEDLFCYISVFCLYGQTCTPPSVVLNSENATKICRACSILWGSVFFSQCSLQSFGSPKRPIRLPFLRGERLVTRQGSGWLRCLDEGPAKRLGPTNHEEEKRCSRLKQRKFGFICSTKSWHE